MSNRRRKERAAARRLHAHQAKVMRRLRRAGSRGSAAALVTSLGLSLGAVALPAHAADGGASLVKDIFAGDASSYPRHLVTLGGLTYFSAESADGIGLWKSDGTPTGTTLVKNLTSGGYGYGAESLTAVGDLLYFTADDADSGRELWKSDGTEAGTVRVADIYPGYDSSYPEWLVNVDGTLYFTASDGVHGVDLWTSDGTQAGTAIVKDFPEGLYNESRPYELTAVGGTLFFTASDDDHGREVWKSDGTAAGTVLVKDIGTLNGGYYGFGGPEALTNVNGTLFFRTDSADDGQELWKSDGTAAGTVMLKDLGADVGAPPQNITNAAGTAYFSVIASTGGQLWKSDGTPSGTVLVKEVPSTDAVFSYIQSVAAVGAKVFFTANEEAHGSELWTSDGTEAGTVLVKDINPGAAYSAPSALTSHKGRLFFSARDASHGRELWMSDGTSAGTVLAADVFAGSDWSSPENLISLGERLLFVAQDDVNGGELRQYTMPTVAPAPSNQFTLPAKAKANAKKGFITVKVTVPGRGVMKVGPAAGSPVRKISTSITAAGAVKVKVMLTKKGLKKLKRLGKMKVNISFTYTPTGGTALKKTKKYLFKYTG